MNWLSRYYDRRADARPRADLLSHVGHTEGGRAISASQFQAMLKSIRERLDLKKSDRLLDLCCGNGVFTRALANDVETIVGLDFSPRLIELASEASRADNITYALHDVKRLADWPAPSGQKFTKVLMNAALQHFSSQEFEAVLRNVLRLAESDRVMLFSFVPDAERKPAFEAARSSDLRLRVRRLLGRDLIGCWWKRSEVLAICGPLGLNAEFLPVDSSLDGSRYRFDIRIW